MNFKIVNFCYECFYGKKTRDQYRCKIQEKNNRFYFLATNDNDCLKSNKYKAVDQYSFYYTLTTFSCFFSKN
jgi:hypothetical protein